MRKVKGQKGKKHDSFQNCILESTIDKIDHHPK
jgi:hypothetical protein